MMEQFIEEKVKKALEKITMASDQTDVLFARLKDYSLELKRETDGIRNDLDGLHARMSELSGMHMTHEKDDDRGEEALLALSHIDKKIEVLCSGHSTTATAVQAQQSQHQCL